MEKRIRVISSYADKQRFENGEKITILQCNYKEGDKDFIVMNESDLSENYGAVVALFKIKKIYNP